MAFINEGQGGDGREGDSGKKNSVFAWHVRVVKVLHHFGALDGEQSCAHGDLVASLVRTMSCGCMVLTHPRTWELVHLSWRNLVHMYVR